MVSSTRQTERRRGLKANKNGRAQRRERVKAGTPAFPVHPPGYDPKAADAKPAPKAPVAKNPAPKSASKTA